MVRKPTEIVGIMVRVRESLRKRLELAAKKSEQSLNAEIIARLEESFRRSDMETIVTEIVRRERKINQLDKQEIATRYEVMHRQMLEVISKSAVDPEELRQAARKAIAEIDEALEARLREQGLTEEQD
jgi:ribosome maturation protein Sdo1